MPKGSKSSTGLNSIKPGLVEVETFVKRPYKINLEIRRAKDGSFSVTLVSRGTKPIARALNRLRAVGYTDYALYFDKYGFIRIHYRGLGREDVLLFKNIVYEALNSKEDARLELPIIA